jgi:hypothetical protein
MAQQEHDEDECKPHKCDNCGKRFEERELKEIEHLSMRVSPGGPTPSGECRECGSLCFPVKE